MDSTDSHPRWSGVGNGPSSPSAAPAFSMNGKVFISSGIILIVIIVFIVAFHLYTRVFWRRRRLSMSWRLNVASPHTGGLHKDIVNSLPTFTYSMPFLCEDGNHVSKEEAGEGVVECAVCLIEFEENDECRLLPKCNHSFHTDCIDKWFLSNTTCPLCRTSAEPDGSNVACRTGSSAAFSLSHQELGDHVGRTSSSPSDCLLSRQDSRSHMLWQGNDNHMQRSSASGPLGTELEGTGLHVRRMLARTCSNGVDVRYDLVGEGTQDDTMSVAMLGERLSSMARDHAQKNLAGTALVQHPPLPNWQRSISDKSLTTREAMQFPSNVLFWGNHSRVDSRLNADHWRVGGRSLPHISIDVRRPQGSFLKPHSALNSPTPCFFVTGERASLSPSGQRQLSPMNPLRNEDTHFIIAEHAKG